ncbi:dTDP-4-dehydrorhamnose reductase [Rudaeicoccus suwonensis]|uniref:dTDP-4-dehydrorhamnose reductase n=1 Tax=Rudaeicoccus suwonensis TaxID=657409 RepID=A0A561E1K4_9MICO|nr:dTDP-4-dehydrorhamnose reductase [Rudaeicoccus suwonensis]TWE09470.1 dTDP-4-dehydrorhamnose reductase [Rudaeicoccus suwonensis]
MGGPEVRWLVIGGRGMLGTDLVDLLQRRGQQVRAVGSAECDIRDVGQVRAAVSGHDVVVNAAAWTAVDDAESHEAEAFALNATGAHNVAVATRDAGSRLVHVSTDYVFDGAATKPYDPAELQQPQSAYGRSKAAGEWAVRAAHPDALVVRTAWLYGAHGPNFVRTMLRLAGERDTWKVVDDQVGQPTWTADLALCIAELVTSGAAGGYHHCSGSGSTTWCGFAREVLRLTGQDPQRIQPCTSDEFPSVVARPKFSCLVAEANPALGIAPWQERLAAYLATQ